MSKQREETEEFEYQLRAQEEYAKAQQQQSGANQQTTEQSQGTFVDPNDGTVYEWDAARGGWFPKVHG